MSYSAEFKGWDTLSLSDLLVAYRKAKADCHYENTFPTAIKFAEYEQDLLANLNSLLSKLKDKRGFAADKNLLGDCRLLPKKLTIEPKPKIDKCTGHAHFSDPERAFAVLKEDKTFIPEFRLIGDFPVDMHVISSLWINLVGHKFDACLDNNCYGARLRRIRNEAVLKKMLQNLFISQLILHLNLISSPISNGAEMV